MKKFSLSFALLLFIVFTAKGQYTLNTPDGKKVKLNPNGTWQYINSKTTSFVEVPVAKDTIALYRATNNQFLISYNPAHWKCDSVDQRDASGWDATFTSKDYAITAYCLASRLSLPIDELEKGMRLQWKDMGTITGFNVYQDTINNTPVTSFVMILESKGINYMYKGFNYSTHKGSFQFLIGTQDNVYLEDLTKIEALIRGFRKL
jgi:hypothetical protein